MARVLHANWVACDRWRDVHLPGGGWRLSYRRVHVQPVPRRKPERSAEIRRRRAYLPPDLCDDPAFAVSSYHWHTWRRTEEVLRSNAGFLGD
jgi:hypothetical protein